MRTPLPRAQHPAHAPSPRTSMLGAGPHPCTTLPRTCPPTPAPTAARSAPCVSLAVVGARRSCRPLQPADGPMPPLVRRFRPDLSPNSSASACRCLRRRPIAASRVGIVPSVLSGPPPDARSRVCGSCFAWLGLFPVQPCVHLWGLCMSQRVDCIPHSLRLHTPVIPRRATLRGYRSSIECIHSEDSYTCLVLYVLRPVPARPAAAVLSAIFGLLRTPSALPLGNLMIARTPPQL